MGTLATRVQERICEQLAATRPAYDWVTEHHVASTPVDVVGRSGETAVFVELEWRRADPADNTAKLFRHLSAGELAAERVLVFQLFTGYYDLARGGVSSKRQNAEFVGRVAADAIDGLTYHPLTLALDPPKRGGALGENWKGVVDNTAKKVTERVSG